ncbi:MAG: hypothetical protein ACOYN0_06655 [Phycisphaerales bacterium]
MSILTPYTPGQRVRVTQQVPRQTGTLTTTIEGVVVGFEQQKTGSWFAHSRDHKLWLDRLRVRKDNGEIVHLNLDQYSHVEVLGDANEAPRASVH